MKRLMSCVFVALAIVIGTYGIYHQMLWENGSPYAQQQWLMELFKKKGFTVVWELNDVIDMSDFGLRRPENPSDELYQRSFNALRGSNFIEFFERKTHVIFFVFGERVYAIGDTQSEGIMNGITSLTMLDKNLIWVRTRGGGEFPLASQIELEMLFPYPEIKALRTRPTKMLWMSWAISSALVMWGVAGWIRDIVRQNRQTRIRERKIPSTAKQPPKHRRNPTKACDQPTRSPPVITKETLLARLQTYINQTEDPARKKQLQILHEKASKERRVSLIQYAVNELAEVILSTDSQESREKVDLVPKNVAPDSLKHPQEQHRTEWLDIDTYVPNPLVACVTRILTVLLHPSGQAPFIGEHRVLRVRLQRIVCLRDFSPDEFTQAFDWLIQQEVILQVNKHGANRSCSINPHADKIRKSEGKAILGIAFRVRQQMIKRR